MQIFLYDPRSTASVVQILESGCIAERRFQTFESHIPFLLQVSSAACQSVKYEALVSDVSISLPLCASLAEQVFADYNIEGMSYLHLANAKVRALLALSESLGRPHRLNELAGAVQSPCSDEAAALG